VEALIKKRVKEGAGRDYDSIVRRDLVNYRRVMIGSAQDGFGCGVESLEEHAEIAKYEGSRQYKEVLMSLTEFDEENLLVDIDKEISGLAGSLTKNQSRLQEIAA
jgi:hypothetical protein